MRAVVIWVQDWEWWVVGRLALACLLGGLLGLQREMTRHQAGLRTHMLVALGAAGFVLAGVIERARLAPDHSIDLGRLIQGLVVGVGFIGAGTIMKEGSSIRGLTTAASLWVACSIGVMAGTGAYFLATVTAFAAMIVLVLPDRDADKDG